MSRLLWRVAASDRAPSAPMRLLMRSRLVSVALISRAAASDRAPDGQNSCESCRSGVSDPFLHQNELRISSTRKCRAHLGPAPRTLRSQLVRRVTRALGGPSLSRAQVRRATPPPRHRAAAPPRRPCGPRARPAPQPSLAPARLRACALTPHSSAATRRLRACALTPHSSAACAPPARLRLETTQLRRLRAACAPAP